MNPISIFSRGTSPRWAKISFWLFSLFLTICLAFPFPAFAQKKGKGKKGGAEEEEDTGLKPGTEIVCEAEVFYSWKRLPPKEETDDKDQKNRSGGRTKKKAPEMEAPEPSEVFFVRTGERGIVESDVVNRLSVRLRDVEKEAMESCEGKYQGSSNCVAKMLKRNSESYRMMDFNSRRALLDAITEDCQNAAGVCLSTRSSDIECYERRPIDLKEEKAEESEAKTGKKKKK